MIQMIIGYAVAAGGFAAYSEIKRMKKRNAQLQEELHDAQLERDALLNGDGDEPGDLDTLIQRAAKMAWRAEARRARQKRLADLSSAMHEALRHKDDAQGDA